MSLDSSIFNKNAFPWIESEVTFDSTKTYPKVTVVVPSYNQGFYLEETLLSIIRQNYPALELIVIDGGSTDNSVEVIKKYENYIKYWISEKDRGQSHAINKGFERATGDWVAWMNSDDCYLEGAFKYIFDGLETIKYDFIHGNCRTGLQIETSRFRDIKVNYKKNIFNLLLFFHSTVRIIPSQSVFLKRELFEKAGLLDEEYHYCMDLEWYCRIYLRTKPRTHFYSQGLSFFRKNEETKSTAGKDKMTDEILKIIKVYRPFITFFQKMQLDSMLDYTMNYKRKKDFKQANLPTLLLVLLKFPFVSIRDISFREALKSWLSFN